VWRTVTITGTPAAAPPPMSQGYQLSVTTYTISGTELDVSKLRQNDRFIVKISGNVDDDARHRTIIDAPLPAGWEIETVTHDAGDYPFLGPLSKPSVEQAMDDRFIAAVDLGGGWPWLSDDSDSVDNPSNNKKSLASNAFAVAYIVRVVTPGTFSRPETVVQDMYRPTEMARTAGGSTVASPR